jgi:hypothetical protein
VFSDSLTLRGNDNMTSLAVVEESKSFRLDLGCGKNKRKDGEWTGVDSIAMDGVDTIWDLTNTPWPWPKESVDEVNCSHVIEHLTNLNGAWQRVGFFNELYRVMKKGAKAQLVFPHWNSNRYYGDPTHKEPFSEMGFYYLSQKWRDEQAPHTDIKNFQHGYLCDFDATWGYSMHPEIVSRPSDYQQFAMKFYKEAVQDIIATLVKL